MTRYTGKLVSVSWNVGTNELHGGNRGIRNPTGGSFHFVATDEVTIRRYHPRGELYVGTEKWGTFFSHDLYKALEGREGTTISWELNQSGNPVNVRVEGVEQVVCPA